MWMTIVIMITMCMIAGRARDHPADNIQRTAIKCRAIRCHNSSRAPCDAERARRAHEKNVRFRCVPVVCVCVFSPHGRRRERVLSVSFGVCVVSYQTACAQFLSNVSLCVVSCDACAMMMRCCGGDCDTVTVTVNDKYTSVWCVCVCVRLCVLFCVAWQIRSSSVAVVVCLSSTTTTTTTLCERVARASSPSVRAHWWAIIVVGRRLSDAPGSKRHGIVNQQVPVELVETRPRENTAQGWRRTGHVMFHIIISSILPGIYLQNEAAFSL